VREERHQEGDKKKNIYPKKENRKVIKTKYIDKTIRPVLTVNEIKRE
jgi:hypothetical protein